MSDPIRASGVRADHRVDAQPNLFDVQRIRLDFPILSQTVNGVPLVYLDNAATSHKPLAVLDAVQRFYSAHNSNINRGVHTLSELATEKYEEARGEVQRFINAAQSSELVFVRGVTEAVNLVAHGYGRRRVGKGDEIVISAMEHHSNIVPWQVLCEERGASLRIIPINDEGDLLLDKLEELLTPRTRLVSVTHLSNVLGSVNPVRKIVEIAHQHGVPVFLDGAQSAPHLQVDVRELGCDFYAFSGHKLYGPTGIGVLYGRSELLEEMLPYQTGGGAISSVTFEKTTYKPAPKKFEAGTPNIAGAIGLGAAVSYVNSLGIQNIVAYELELLEYAMTSLARIPWVRLIGKPQERASILSFVVDGVHAHDVGTILDSYGIAIRSGHHCAQPLIERLGLIATARASLAFYNSKEEIDALVGGIHRVREIFGH